LGTHRCRCSLPGSRRRSRSLRLHLKHRDELDGGAPGRQGLLDLIRCWLLGAEPDNSERGLNQGGRTLASPAIVDLFAGAGGLSVGALASGGDVRLLVDHDADSCETARRNHPPDVAVLQADVAELTGEQLRQRARVSQNEPLIIIGGPPCQPFSKAAYWLEPGAEAQYRRDRASGLFPTRPEPLSEARSDDRRSLVEEFWRLLREADADAFVFENVPSILHPRNRPVAEALIKSAEEVGYQVTMVRGMATSFGVAQKRERVFVLASRHLKPLAPTPTHSVTPENGLLRTPTTGDVLDGVAVPKEPEETVTGRWAEHLRQIPPGWNYKWHTEWAGHAHPTWVTETRFWNFLLKLDPEKPSWTLPASPGPWVGPFHWDSRRLRTAEYAALQGFPGDYQFVGDRRSRIRQIGNAVPAPMAAAMLGSVLATIPGASSTDLPESLSA
jgi:DNA (cytosine-5)-methyltransferase 1